MSPDALAKKYVTDLCRSYIIDVLGLTNANYDQYIQTVSLLIELKHNIQNKLVYQLHLRFFALIIDGVRKIYPESRFEIYEYNLHIIFPSRLERISIHSKDYVIRKIIPFIHPMANAFRCVDEEPLKFDYYLDQINNLLEKPIPPWISPFKVSIDDDDGDDDS